MSRWAGFRKKLFDYMSVAQAIAFGATMCVTYIEFRHPELRASLLPLRLGTMAAFFFAMLAVILLSNTGAIAAYALLAIGLANSIMFPTIFSLACEGLGPKAAAGSGIICIAIVGGAVIPPLTGQLADMTGSLSIALALPAICYAIIAGFGVFARKPAA